MICSFTPFGGGSRAVSLWNMLRFHADKFVEVLNYLNLLETLMGQSESQLKDMTNVAYYGSMVEQLNGQLKDLGLKVSAKKAHQLHFALTQISADERSHVWGTIIGKHINELRERVADELEGKAIYYISDHVDLLSDAPPFGGKVERAFPSARYDISEAGRCLALRRSTACVLHLMRALEVALASLTAALGQSMTASNWNTILRVLETEIRSHDKKALGEKWSAEDEQFFAEAATHFLLIKNAWRNHAVHGRDIYTEDRAEEIYDSVRSFMHHLSERLSEEGLSS